MAANDYKESDRTNEQPDAYEGPGAAEANGSQKNKPNPVVLIAMTILIVAGAIWGIDVYRYNLNHPATDDAYVTGDLINVSPIISGTLAKLYVDEGDQVKAGQIVARLDDSGPRAAYEQATANWRAAQSQIPQAQTNLSFTTQTTIEQIKQAEAALESQDAKVGQETRRAQMTQKQTSSQLAQAQAQEQAALQQVQTAQAQYGTAVAAVKTAQAAEAAVRQQVAVAQASATKTHRDAIRYASLYGPNGSIGAVTSQQYDAAVAADQTAAAQLAQAQDQVKQADEAIAQAQAAAQAALAAVESTKSQANATHSAVAVARAGLLAFPVQLGAVLSNRKTESQNVAQLGIAQAGSQQIKLHQQMIDTYTAQALAAKQTVAEANVTLNDTVIAAPSDGTVVKKGANVGDALQPGQTIFTMTRGQNVWITANYKETQVQDMEVGQAVDIDVDAFPGIVFRGKVQSINHASGNATALLPADNATGNFTKVVQRIPVKILLVAEPRGNKEHFASQDLIARLRQGMSVTAKVDTRK